MRALVAAAFGILTIFWPEPGDTVMALAGGAFLLLSGAAVWLLARKPEASEYRTLLQLEAGAFAVAGALTFALQTPSTFTILATAALLIGGGAELVLWWQNRGPQGSVLSKDWLIVGIVSVGFGGNLSTFTGTSQAAPHVAATRLRWNRDKIVEVETLWTTTGYWLFNAEAYLKYSSAEKWDPIPVANRDTRGTLVAAANAYLDAFLETKIDLVPWGFPCVRIEGGA